MAVGATQAHPGYFPEGFGFGRREASRNDFLGTVFTWPEAKTFIFGVVYFDREDGQDNEDMHRLDLTKFETTQYKPRAFAREFKQYGRPHREAKGYLRQPPDPDDGDS